jgi:hypothetical protein
MTESAVRAPGLAASICYAALIVWLYAHQPQSFAEVSGGLSATIGAYQIDQPAFDEGLRLFRGGQFEAARAAFERADPVRKDSRTQFYTAYAFSREGWGRFHDDDRLFGMGLEAADRAIALAPHGTLREDDPDLLMHSADELRAELQAGVRSDASDMNPLAVFRRRK